MFLVGGGKEQLWEVLEAPIPLASLGNSDTPERKPETGQLLESRRINLDSPNEPNYHVDSKADPNHPPPALRGSSSPWPAGKLQPQIWGKWAYPGHWETKMTGKADAHVGTSLTEIPYFCDFHICLSLSLHFTLLFNTPACASKKHDLATLGHELSLHCTLL